MQREEHEKRHGGMKETQRVEEKVASSILSEQRVGPLCENGQRESQRLGRGHFLLGGCLLNE